MDNPLLVEVDSLMVVNTIKVRKVS